MKDKEPKPRPKWRIMVPGHGFVTITAYTARFARGLAKEHFGLSPRQRLPNGSTCVRDR